MAHSLENEENAVRAYTIQDVNLNTLNRWSINSGIDHVSALEERPSVSRPKSTIDRNSSLYLHLQSKKLNLKAKI
jgi:hypothetical protein